MRYPFIGWIISRRNLISLIATGFLLAWIRMSYLNTSSNKSRWAMDDIKVSSQVPQDFHQMEIDYWKAINVETMTPEQIIEYFKWSNWTACEYRHYFGGQMQLWDPTGIDGQYPVCLDPAVRLISSKEKRCIVYSFGINYDWSFDEAMEKYGCEVFAFDPSMNKTDYDHSQHIHFYQIGLGDNDIDDNNVPDVWKFKTLDSIYRMLVPRHGETIIDYLKIDIEYDEWEVLKQILKSEMLKNVKQLTIEFHLPNKLFSTNKNTHLKMNIEDYRSLVRLVKSIENQMTRFESRSNLWSKKSVRNLNNYTGPICFELSFYQIFPRDS